MKSACDARLPNGRCPPGRPFASEFIRAADIALPGRRTGLLSPPCRASQGTKKDAAPQYLFGRKALKRVVKEGGPGRAAVTKTFEGLGETLDSIFFLRPATSTSSSSPTCRATKPSPPHRSQPTKRRRHGEGRRSDDSGRGGQAGKEIRQLSPRRAQKLFRRRASNAASVHARMESTRP